MALYRFPLDGVHRAELLWLAVAGKRIEARGLDLFHSRDKKIVKLRQRWDRDGVPQHVTATEAK